MAKEILIQIVAESAPEDKLEALDEIICELFHTESVIITTQTYEVDE